MDADEFWVSDCKNRTYRQYRKNNCIFGKIYNKNEKVNNFIFPLALLTPATIYLAEIVLM